MSTYETPIPGAAQYGQQQAAAQQAYQNALARIGQQRGDLLRQYGYEGTFDASGNLSGLRVSANAPYGAYQQMARGQAQESNQAQDSLVDRGIQGGFANQMTGQLDQAHGQAKAQMGQDLERGVTDLLDNQRQAGTDYQNTIAELQHNAAQEAINNQQFDQGDYSGLDYGDAGPNYKEQAVQQAMNHFVGGGRAKARAKPARRQRQQRRRGH